MKDYRYPAATPYIIKARGNWKTIQAFVEKYANQQDRALKLLSTLSDKDLRDMPMEILEDNMKAKNSLRKPLQRRLQVSVRTQLYWLSGFARTSK